MLKIFRSFFYQYFTLNDVYWFGAYFLLRLFSFIVLPSPDSMYNADSIYYENIAISLLEKGIYTNPASANPFSDIIRTPGYPLFIWANYGLFGKTPWVLSLWNVLFLALEYALLKQILKKLNISFHIGLWVFTLMDFTRWVFNASVLAEPLFNVLILAATLLTLHYIHSQKYIYLIVSGILWGLAALVKPVALYAPAIICIYLLLKTPLKNSLKATALLLIAFFVALSPWLIRNYIKYGTFTFTYIQADNLLYSHCAYILSQKQGISVSQAQAQLFSEIEKKSIYAHPQLYSELNEWKLQLAKQIIAENIFIYVQWWVKGTFITLFDPARMDTERYLYTNYKNEAVFTNQLSSGGIPGILKAIFSFEQPLHYLLAYNLVYACLFAFLVGMGIGFCKQLLKQDGLLIVCLLIYFTLLSAVGGNARFRYYLFPFLYIFAQIGWNYLYKTLFKPRFKNA